MNCDWASQLIDDLLENRLGRLERQRLEDHLLSCRACSEELRTRPAFDHTLGRGLVASVQHLELSPGASQRIIHESLVASRRGIWSRRALRGGQAVAGLAAVVLLLAAVYLLVTRIDFPVQLVPSNTLSPSEMVAQERSRPRALSVPPEGLFVEPFNMQPHEAFTITLYIASERLEPTEKVRLALDLSGPTGDYHFVVDASGPFASEGVSALELTPGDLASICQEQYDISPTEIFGQEGVYTIRTTLFSPALSLIHI